MCRADRFDHDSKMGAREVLTRVEQRARSGGFAVPDVVKNPENYPRSTVDSVVQGLENLALGKEPESVRSGAAVALASAGSDKHIIAGVFDRKVQVYRKSTNNMVRGMIIAYIGEGQERGRAIEFLKSVATEDAPPGFDQAPYLAAHALVNFGVPGIAALRELDARGIVRDAKTSGFVNGFLLTRRNDAVADMTLIENYFPLTNPYTAPAPEAPLRYVPYLRRVITPTISRSRSITS